MTVTNQSTYPTSNQIQQLLVDHSVVFSIRAAQPTVLLYNSWLIGLDVQLFTNPSTFFAHRSRLSKIGIDIINPPKDSLLPAHLIKN